MIKSARVFRFVLIVLLSRKTYMGTVSEGKMTLISWPLLECRALVKIAIEMWNARDIRPLVNEFVPPHNHGPLEDWQRIEVRVKNNISRLCLPTLGKIAEGPLPTLLQTKLHAIIKVIGSHILAWKNFHFDQCNLSALPKEFIWTPRGTIDKIKTIEMLIADEDLDVDKRYVLACTYCLVDYIRKLRRTVDYNVFIARHELYSCIVSFWLNHRGEERIEPDQTGNRPGSTVDSNQMYRELFFRATASGNEPATRFFLKMLTHDKHAFVMRCMGLIAGRTGYGLRCNAWFSVEYSADVLCFLLSELPTEQKALAFIDFPCEILACHLEWPRQEIFMEMARDSWDFLSKTDYHSTLQRLADKIVLNVKDYDYKGLFAQFWKEGPPLLKDFAAELCLDGILLSKLLRAEDEKNIELVLEHKDVAGRDEVIAHIAKDAVMELVYKNSFDFLEFFFRKCRPSQSAMNSFKEKFIPFVPSCHRKQILEQRHYPKPEEESIWDKFYKLLDRLDGEDK